LAALVGGMHGPAVQATLQAAGLAPLAAVYAAGEPCAGGVCCCPSGQGHVDMAGARRRRAVRLPASHCWAAPPTACFYKGRHLHAYWITQLLVRFFASSLGHWGPPGGGGQLAAAAGCRASRSSRRHCCHTTCCMSCASTVKANSRLPILCCIIGALGALAVYRHISKFSAAGTRLVTPGYHSEQRPRIVYG
jgi:hypothetical protein